VPITDILIICSWC